MTWSVTDGGTYLRWWFNFTIFLVAYPYQILVLSNYVLHYAMARKRRMKSTVLVSRNYFKNRNFLNYL